jgi:hypothetical protein
MNGLVSRGIRCVPEQRVYVVEFMGLPAGAEGFFRRKDPFSTMAWYRATVSHAIPEGATPAFLVAEQAGRVLAVLPMLRGPGSRLASLASPYASLWQPLFFEEAGHDPACVRRVGLAVGLACQATPVLRLEALDAGSGYVSPLAQGFRDSGFFALRFDHFGNWHQALPETWAAYLAGRPPNLRATIRRRGKRLLGELEKSRAVHEFC